jgi:DNA polymerase (family 10)
VTPAALPQTFRQLADFAEIRGISLEATDWRRLAANLEEGGADEAKGLIQLARRNRFSELSSVHPELHGKLRSILLDGPDAAVGAALANLPWLLRRLLEFATVDSAGAAALARDAIVTLGDLIAAFHDGRLRVGNDLDDRLRSAANGLIFERPQASLGRAVELLDNLILLIGAAAPELELRPAGDVRRVEPLVDALVIVGAAADPPAALDVIAALPSLRVLHRTGRRALVSYQQMEVDVRIAAPDEFGTTLYVATGSDHHLIKMRSRQGSPRIYGRETEVYADAGLSWIAPELRHDTGEIEAAASGALPTLVGREDIRGDLHLHTTYSDGRDSLEEMVQTAAALGYEYIAITDHSERSAASKTLTKNTLMRQREEIDVLRQQFPALTILQGVEVDIMGDGSLDFPDDVLETLDIVLASLHDSKGHDPARLTRRYFAAMEHPLVNVITHPANRLVGRDSGYALDFAEIYAAAAATGTALEIDGAPSHLDLDGERARAAVAAGVTITIDSDCHKARLLDRQMRLGVGTARRGWVEARHVLNTRPLDEVRTFIAAKRGGQQR